MNRETGKGQPDGPERLSGCGTCFVIVVAVSVMGLFIAGPTLLKIAQGLFEIGQEWGLW